MTVSEQSISRKASGIDWLGEIPTNWEVKRVGVLFSERRVKVSDRDFEPLSVTKSGVVPQLETAAKSDDGDNRKLVCEGDFVINSRSDRKGSSGLSTRSGSVSLINTVLKPEGLHGTFVHHLLRSVSFQEEFYRYGKGIVADLWSTNYSEMKAIMLPVPPIEEQRAIAEFLDRETAKIDKIIEKQERLIELLNEKRQAVISHAVTKGLDPSVPMKESGIDWLGEVPAHWNLKLFKHLVQFTTSGSRGWADFYAEQGSLFLRIANVTRDGIDLDLSNRQYVVPPEGLEAQRSRVQEDDVLISITADLGSVAVVGKLEAPAYVSQHVSLSRPKRDIVGRWLAYSIRATPSQRQFWISGYGGTKIQLSLSDVSNVVLAVPNFGEQIYIVRFIDFEMVRLNKLAERITKSIELMKERRAALISAAVTGKIDVSKPIMDRVEAGV